MLIFTTFTSCAFALNIQVFTDTTHPVNASGITTATHLEYYNLDQLNLLLRKMNLTIHGENKEIAEAQAKKMMQEYKPEIYYAVLGIKLARKYNINEIPATVFDQGKYIVFGQTVLQKSIQDYKQWLKQQK